MKLPKYSGQLKKPKLFVRQVHGSSMEPGLKPGAIVIVRSSGKLWPGRIVLLQHGGLEKIKRIASVTTDGLYVLGDNAAASTDSRQFGLLPRSAVRGVVIWPRRALGLDASETIHAKPDADK